MMQPPNRVPILGQQIQRPSIDQVIQQVALGMYVQLATAYIGSQDRHEAVDPDHLRQLALNARTAVKAYFEPQEAPNGQA